MLEHIDRISLRDVEQVPLDNWRDVIKIPVISENQSCQLYPSGVNELNRILVSSIRKCAARSLLDNNGNIYTTLSGGVDSSLCLAILTRHVPLDARIHTFTVGGSVNHPDILFSRQIAALYNTEHHETIIDSEAKRLLVDEFTTCYGDTPETQMMIDRSDTSVWAVYREIAKMGATSVIAHDGIDELMGGYWRHRQSANEGKDSQEGVFRFFWSQLGLEHLDPLDSTASHFGIRVLLPYLQRDLVSFISTIPVNQRASFETGKILIKQLAEVYGLPKEVIYRKKFGFVDALNY